MAIIKATAPGSIMLMGEHAVLFGERAIACAVDKYITVTLTPVESDQISVNSALGTYQGSLTQLSDCAELSFVVAALRRFANRLPSGFVMNIEAGFSHTVGLGSSAAVTAAVVAVLRKVCSLTTAPADIFDDALNVVHSVQNGRGSGTDLVASIYGGLVAYTVSPRQITPLNEGLPPISLFYAGYKTKTPDVLAKVEAYTQNHQSLFGGVYRLMGQTTEAAEAAMLKGDWVA
ncbi:MAG: mevalonate kinase family protein, partial [Pontibacterium sp.]